MIFLDANFIVSLNLKKHDDYKKAKKLWDLYKNEKTVISNLVIVEVITVLYVQLKHNLELIEKVYKFMMDELIIIDDSKYHDDALNLLKSYYPDRIPIADFIYMALMNDFKITDILSFDGHFDNKENINRIY